MMKSNLIVKTRFEAAHFLPCHNGKCKNLHGHTWEIIVRLRGKVDPKTGMVMDFGILKPLLKECLPDHRPINNITCPHCQFIVHQGAVPDLVPTAENLARYLYFKFNEKVTPLNLTLVSVEVWESADACAMFDESCF